MKHIIDIGDNLDKLIKKFNIDAKDFIEHILMNIKISALVDIGFFFSLTLIFSLSFIFIAKKAFKTEDEFLFLMSFITGILSLVSLIFFVINLLHIPNFFYPERALLDMLKPY